MDGFGQETNRAIVSVAVLALAVVCGGMLTYWHRSSRWRGWIIGLGVLMVAFAIVSVWMNCGIEGFFGCATRID